jgi:hypothetical protein
MPARLRGGPQKGELEWRRVNRPTLLNLFSNPIYAGVYAYGVRAVDRRRQIPGRPRTGRRPPRANEAEVFLPDSLPAYISLERFQGNLTQLKSNMATSRGTPRSGTALLSGLVVCGRCGLRMHAQYNNNGHAPRYTCMRMQSDYGEPLCQSLKATPLDDLIVSLMLEAIAPVAIEVSIAMVADLEAERAAVDNHWRMTLERAAYNAERARRQHAAVEPENRLVARSLEAAWEAALAEQARLHEEYEHVKRTQPQTPTEDEIAAIRELPRDLAALWRDESTTQDERQTIARLLLDRVLVEVVGNSEKVRVECHWHGDNRTNHELTRPVGRLDALSTYAAMTGRAAELRHEGLDFAKIADILNNEGWRPAKRRDTFNASMVRHLLINSGAETVKHRKRSEKYERRPNEWRISELAEEIGMPQSTLYAWIQKGLLSCRNAGESKYARFIFADPETILALKEVRATPLPWRRILPPEDARIIPSTNS